MVMGHGRQLVFFFVFFCFNFATHDFPNMRYTQKKKQKEAENAEGQAAGGKRKKVTAAQLRVQKGALCPLS